MVINLFAYSFIYIFQGEVLYIIVQSNFVFHKVYSQIIWTWYLVSS